MKSLAQQLFNFNIKEPNSNVDFDDILFVTFWIEHHFEDKNYENHEKYGFRIYYLNSPVQILLLNKWEIINNNPKLNKLAWSLHKRAFFGGRKKKERIEFEKKCVDRANKDWSFAIKLKELRPAYSIDGEYTLKYFVERDIDKIIINKPMDLYWSEKVLDE